MKSTLYIKTLQNLAGLGLRLDRHATKAALSGTPAGGLGWRELGTLHLGKVAAEAMSSAPVVYDIGANVGCWSRLMLSLKPNAKIEAFEPLESHVKMFNASLGHNPWVRIHRVALGPEDTQLALNVTSFSDSASFLSPTEELAKDFEVTAGPTAVVDVVNLDRFAATHGLPAPELIKLDVQGYEIEALRGAEECMRNAKWVLCEVSLKEYYKGQPLIGEVIQFMACRGYRVAALSGEGVRGVLTQQVDLLFSK